MGATQVENLGPHHKYYLYPLPYLQNIRHRPPILETFLSVNLLSVSHHQWKESGGSLGEGEEAQVGGR